MTEFEQMLLETLQAIGYGTDNDISGADLVATMEDFYQRLLRESVR